MATRSKGSTTRARGSQPQQGGRKPPPEGETKRGKFLRIGQARMVNVLHAIRLLGNLSGDNYAWTPEDLVLMHNTLTDALQTVFRKFDRKTGGPKLEDTFRLSELAHAQGTALAGSDQPNDGRIDRSGSGGRT